MAHRNASSGGDLVKDLQSKRCKHPFVIWFRERSGSSHLQAILDNHPDIVCRGEHFFHSAPVDLPPSEDVNEFFFQNRTFVRCISNRLPAQTPIVRPTKTQILEHLYYIYSLHPNACGYKLKYPIQFEMYPEVCEALRELSGDLRVIVLHRKNILKQVISRFSMLRIREAAGLCNLPRDKKEVGPNTKLTVDVKRALGLVQHFKDEEKSFFEDIKKLEQQAGMLKVLRIDYEDLLADEAGQSRRAFEFLGADPDAKVESLYRKATSDDLASVVENYDELVAEVTGTEFESMLK